MKDEKLHALWENEKNWGHGRFGCYFCKDDPRLVVPKRGLPGGTFNMAHRLAVPLLTAIILLLIILVLIGFLGQVFR